jgi:hypothetical protein
MALALIVAVILLMVMHLTDVITHLWNAKRVVMHVVMGVVKCPITVKLDSVLMLF